MRVKWATAVGLLTAVTLGSAAAQDIGFGQRTVEVAGSDRTVVTYGRELHGKVGDGNDASAYVLGVRIDNARSKGVAVEFDASQSRSLESSVRVPFRTRLNADLPEVLTLLNYSSQKDPGEYRPVLFVGEKPKIEVPWAKRLSWSATYPQLEELIGQLKLRIASVPDRYKPILPTSCTATIPNDALLPPGRLNAAYNKAFNALTLSDAIAQMDSDIQSLTAGTGMSQALATLLAGANMPVSAARANLLQDFSSLRANYLNKDCRRYLYHSGLLPRHPWMLLSEVDPKVLRTWEHAWRAAAITGAIPDFEQYDIQSSPAAMADIIAGWRKQPMSTAQVTKDPGRAISRRPIIIDSSRSAIASALSWWFLEEGGGTERYDSLERQREIAAWNARNRLADFFKEALAQKKIDYEKPWVTAQFLAESIATIQSISRQALAVRSYAPTPWEPTFVNRNYREWAYDRLNLKIEPDWQCKDRPADPVAGVLPLEACSHNNYLARQNQRAEQLATEQETLEIGTYQFFVEALISELEGERTRFLLMQDIVELQNSVSATETLKDKAHELIFGTEAFRLVAKRSKVGDLIEQGTEIATIHPALKEALIAYIGFNDPLVGTLRVGSRVAVKVVSDESLPIPSLLLNGNGQYQMDSAEKAAFMQLSKNWSKKLEFEGVVAAIEPFEDKIIVELILDSKVQQYVIFDDRESNLPSDLKYLFKMTMPMQTKPMAGPPGVQVTYRLPDSLFSGMEKFKILIVPVDAHSQNAYRDTLVARQRR